MGIGDNNNNSGGGVGDEWATFRFKHTKIPNPSTEAERKEVIDSMRQSIQMLEAVAKKRAVQMEPLSLDTDTLTITMNIRLRDVTTLTQGLRKEYADAATADNKRRIKVLADSVMQSFLKPEKSPPAND